MPLKWVYDLTSSEYLFGGNVDPPFDPATQGVDTFQDTEPHPDARLERHALTGGRRPATTQEITDYDQIRAQMALDSLKTLKALSLVVADLHGLTPAQIRAQVIAKYRSL